MINDSFIQTEENCIIGLGNFVDNRNVYISYDLNNSNLDISSYATTATKQGNYTLPGTPTKEGFTFLGWGVFEGETSRGQFDANETITFSNVEWNEVDIRALFGRRQ